MKRCIKCGVDLILGENWLLSAKQKCKYTCGDCNAKYGREYRDVHREEIREKGKIHRSKIKDVIKKRHRKYYINNKDRILEKERIYRQEHLKEMAEIKRVWGILNRDKILQYKEDHKEEIRIYQREYKKNHREELNRNARELYNTPEGKEKVLRRQARRERRLGWVPLFDNPFPPEIDVEWHHISDAFVIALPKIVHRSNLGYGHREKLQEYVEMFYNISYLII